MRLVSWGLPCKLNNCSPAPFRITAVLAFYAQRFNCALLFADAVTFWSNSHLSSFKGLWPLHVWSPQFLCCFITRALQREQLHHPHTYALIKHAPRSAFMCSHQPTLPVQPWFWMNLQNATLVLMTKLVFTWWLHLKNWEETHCANNYESKFGITGIWWSCTIRQMAHSPTYSNDEVISWLSCLHACPQLNLTK